MRDPALHSNRTQCLLALIGAGVVAVCVCAGVVMNLVTLYDENFDHMGIRTFCMFTVDSNILAALAMLLCVPYTIDGLRTGYYHLPDWVVVLMHVAVTAVTLTFLVSLFILAPVKGFVLIFTGSRFFLHGVCPVLSIVTFCCFINSHLVRLEESPLALIPVLIYALVYLVMVVLIGEERGGWNDFYGFATRIPVWVSLIAIAPITFGIATLLRLGHNGCCLSRRKKDAEIYRKAYTGVDLMQAVEDMARACRRERNSGRVVIPYKMIGYMIQNSGADLDQRDLCRHWLEVFLDEAGI